MVENNTLHYTIQAGIRSQIVIKTLPGGICTLYREDESNLQSSLKIFADQDGIIRFYVHPAMKSDFVVKVVIDCDVNGNISRFPLEFRVDSKLTDGVSHPNFEYQNLISEDNSILPALLEDKMLQSSQNDLLALGYPPRPNREKMPMAFDIWRRVFSRPSTFIEPKLISNPDISNSPGKRELPIEAKIRLAEEKSSNWSGYVLSSGGPYCVVTGLWRVPDVYNWPRNGRIEGHTYSSFWVGLDGWEPFGLADLVQAGTEQQCLMMHDLTFTSYYAWTEFLPQQPTEQVISNFSVHPGDLMYVSVWMGDNKSNLNLNGNGIFWLSNLTTHQHTTITTLRGKTVVSGIIAEWIMERPTVNLDATHRGYSDLADYNSATMSSAYAAGSGDKSGIWYSDDTNFRTRMVNGKNILSTVMPIDYGTMRFSWKAFR